MLVCVQMSNHHNYVTTTVVEFQMLGDPNAPMDQVSLDCRCATLAQASSCNLVYWILQDTGRSSPAEVPVRGGKNVWVLDSVPVAV